MRRWWDAVSFTLGMTLILISVLVLGVMAGGGITP